MFPLIIRNFLVFVVCVGGGEEPGCVAAGAGGGGARGAVSIDRAAAHRFRVPLTHGLRFCHYSPVARCQLL